MLTYADKPYFVRRGGTLVLENYPVPPVIARGSAVRDRGRRMLASSPLVRLLGWTSRPGRRDLRLIGGRRDAPRSLLEQYLLEERPGWAEARAVTEDLVRRLSAVVARQGARLAVVLVPDKMAVLPKSLDTTFALSSLRGHAHDALRPHRELVALVERTGIPFLALLPDFQQHQAAGSPPTFFARDSHWNAAGHALAAERLAPFVRALLADAPSR